MTLAFNASKFLFYVKLRKDPLVQKLGTEQKIRDLVEDMILYEKHANYANYDYSKICEKEIKGIYSEKKEMRNIGNLILLELQKAKYKQVENNFEDIEEIAYLIGTYQDRRNLLQKIFIDKNPLEEKNQEYRKHVENLEQTGKFAFQCFNKEIIADLYEAIKLSKDKDLLSESYEKFTTCFNHYVDRRENLEILINSRRRIHQYYLNGSYLDKKLSFKTTKKIAQYFQKQREINGARFELLHLASSIAKNAHEKWITKEAHRNFVNSFEK